MPKRFANNCKKSAGLSVIEEEKTIDYFIAYEEARTYIEKLEEELSDVRKRAEALEDENKTFIEKLEEVKAFLEDDILYGANRLKEEIRRLV